MSAGGPAYSEVLEDWAVVSPALDIGERDVVVSVSSAGDNVFHAALDGGRHVFGVDIEPLQTELCRLKEAAVQRLSWEEFAMLVGVLPAAADVRAALLERLPDRVEPLSEVLPRIEQGGLVGCGQLAAFVAPLRAGLQRIVGADELRRVLTTGDPRERAALFGRHIDTPAVLELLASGLNEATISNAFIPAAAWGRMAEPAFHRFYHAVLRRLIVDRDPTTNPFLHRLWLDAFPSQEDVPRYLRAGEFARLRERIERITWHTADLTSFLATLPDRSVDALNVSNVPDWCDDAEYELLWAAIDRVASPGARCFVRSFLAERPLPAGLDVRWTCAPDRSRAMSQADRVGYYSRYELWTRVRSEG